MIANTKLSKTVSLILRHDPASYGIELDRDGWVSVSSLLSALKGKELCWRDLTASHLEEMVRRSEKRRHEIQDGRIRALYGHSTPDRLFREATRPPDLLYHGTDPAVVAAILSEGLRPMARQHVHLSQDYDTAFEVGSRKAAYPVILLVRAGVAQGEGVAFYRGNESVWLADCVPAVFIAKVTDR